MTKHIQTHFSFEMCVLEVHKSMDISKGNLDQNWIFDQKHHLKDILLITNFPLLLAKE
jgi:hypothetical protein